MKSVVYINNDMIQIVQAQYEGSFDIKSQTAVELEMGSVVNGVIINKDDLINKLINLKSKLTKPILVIDSSSIILKRLDIPKMNKAQATELLSYELGVQDVQEEYIYDVNFIENKNDFFIIGSAVPKNLIESYIDVFKEADIRLSKIDILANSVSKFVSINKSFEKETFLLNIISSENIVSFLFEKGKYKLMNRNKIMIDSDSNEYIDELFSKLSSMIQFHKSQKSDYPIVNSYYVGLGKENTKKLDKYVTLYEPDINIKEMVLPSNKLSGTDGSLFYALTGIFHNKKDIDFLEAYKENISKNRLSKKTILKISLPAILCAFIFAGYSFINIDQKNLNLEINDMEKFVSEQSNLDKVEEYNQYISLKQKFSDILLEIQDSKNSLDSAKIIDINSIKRVFEESKSGILIDGITFNSSEKTLLILGSSKNVLDCSEFISKLYDTELFETINYKGYTNEQITKGDFSMTENNYMPISEDRYRFTAKAILKAGGKVE